MNTNYFKAILLASIILTAAAVSAQTTKTEPAPVAQTQNLQTIKLKVSGITCSGDVKDIQKAISKMEGVAACKPVGKPSANSQFEISFHPSVISVKEIRKAVEDTPGCENPNDRPYKVKQG